VSDRVSRGRRGQPRPVFASLDAAPDTHYVRSRDGSRIAYQVFGSGEQDLVYIPGFPTNLDLSWMLPQLADFLAELAQFTRVIVFDRRGTGLSDPITQSRIPSLEARLDDVKAVMNAAGSRRAVLMGDGDGAALAILFAASLPERTGALVTFSAHARGLWAADYPWAWREDEWATYLASLEAGWGERSYMRTYLAWAGAGDEDFLSEDDFNRWLVYCRCAASPAQVALIDSLDRDTDVRGVLKSISLPTLVLHRSDNAVEPVGQAHFIGERIREAVVKVLPGSGNIACLGDSFAVLDQIRGFLGISRGEVLPDRRVVTVLFTDLVRSTAVLARIGDAEWKRLIRRHHQAVRSEFARFGGREVDTAGDGFFATFDGPARAVRCAELVLDIARSLNVEARAGVHTGEVETIDQKAGGLAVVIAARIMGLAGPSQVFVSRTVKDLTAGSGLIFEAIGHQSLKGLEEPWELFAVHS
jgi:class 3 adenylate cyclase/pimeloyl-ACP methyl ester carboxylesterase